MTATDPPSPGQCDAVHASFADMPFPGHGGAISDMRLDVELRGDRLHGTADVHPHAWLPGSDVVRTSVLNIWCDNIAGMLAGESAHPRITVTLDLEFQLIRPIRGEGTIQLESRVVKPGRQVTVVQVDLWDERRDRPFAVAVGSFVASPNPDHVAPEGGFIHRRPPGPRSVPTMPIAQRARVQRLGGGVATIPHVLDNINATGSIHGGLISLAAEEAVLDARPGVLMSAVNVRYLRALRADAVARAEVREGFATVELTAGDSKIGSLATVRLSPVP